jgi:hypothetical protein
VPLGGSPGHRFRPRLGAKERIVRSSWPTQATPAGLGRTLLPGGTLHFFERAMNPLI